MCTYTVVTHPCHIPLLAQARPIMLCIYTSIYEKSTVQFASVGLAQARPNEKLQLNRLVWGLLMLAPIIHVQHCGASLGEQHRAELFG